MARCTEWFREQVDAIKEQKSLMISLSSGILFAFGWWILIDCASVYPDNHDLNHAYHVCGVVATIALIMVNSVSNEQMQGGIYTDGVLGTFGTRIWLFVGFLLSFISVIAALWILFEGYVAPGFSPLYPGVAIVLQNVFILAASMLFKFGHSDDF